MTWYMNATPNKNTKLMNTVRVDFTDENEIIFKKSVLTKHDYIDAVIRSRDIFTIFTLHVFIHDWMVHNMKIKGGTYHLDINNRMLMFVCIPPKPHQSSFHLLLFYRHPYWKTRERRTTIHTLMDFSTSTRDHQRSKIFRSLSSCSLVHMCMTRMTLRHSLQMIGDVLVQYQEQRVKLLRAGDVQEYLSSEEKVAGRHL